MTTHETSRTRQETLYNHLNDLIGPIANKRGRLTLTEIRALSIYAARILDSTNSLEPLCTLIELIGLSRTRTILFHLREGRREQKAEHERAERERRAKRYADLNARPCMLEWHAEGADDGPCMLGCD